MRSAASCIWKVGARAAVAAAPAMQWEAIRLAVMTILAMGLRERRLRLSAAGDE